MKKLYSFYDLFDEILNENANVFYDVKLNEDSSIIEIPVPGLTKNDIELKVVKNILKIKIKNEEQNKWLKLITKEFKLNENVDVEKLSAKVENGLLSIELKNKKDNEFLIELS